MRIYRNNTDIEIEKVFCNACGKELLVENGIVKEGCFHVEYTFGYFTDKDGTKHKWDLCEDCYDKMVKNFAIPVDVKDESELL